MSMSKDIEGIVAKFVDNYIEHSDAGVLVKYEVNGKDIDDFFSDALQSQADQQSKHEHDMYESLEKHYKEMVKEMLGDGASDVSVWHIKTIAQKYGVDLSE